MLPPSRLLLFCHPVSSSARAIWILLTHSQLTFDIRKATDLTSEEEGFLTPYIDDQVAGSGFPLLKDGETVVQETFAIIRYIISKYHLEAVWGSDSTSLNMFVEWHLLHLFPASNRVLKLTTDYTPQRGNTSGTKLRKSVDLEKVGEAFKHYIACLEHFDKVLLKDQRFISGSKASMVDLVACTEISFFRVLDIDLSLYPNLLQWYDNVRSFVSQEIWDTVHQDFDRFVALCYERLRAQKAHEQKIKKHGKDATGGNRAPDISHTVIFQRSPEEVFEMLTNAEKLQQLTGSACQFMAKPGGQFSLYNGQFKGVNLFLEEGKRIFQSWTFADWPMGINSTVKIMLEKSSGTSGSGTVLRLSQNDVPTTGNAIKKADEVWDTLFWKPLGGVLTRNILQQVFFENLSPHDFYDLMTDSTKCSKITRSRCEISRKVGADVSYLDGLISGKNVDLITDVKIVQQWRCGEWPEGHFSLLSLEITRVAGATAVTHSQEKVPVEFHSKIAELWDRHFWKKLQKGGGLPP